MFCHECGVAVKPEDKFCEACGAPQKSVMPTKKNENDISDNETLEMPDRLENEKALEKNAGSPLPWFIGAIVAVAVFFLLGGKGATPNNSDSEKNTGVYGTDNQFKEKQNERSTEDIALSCDMWHDFEEAPSQYKYDDVDFIYSEKYHIKKMGAFFEGTWQPDYLFSSMHKSSNVEAVFFGDDKQTLILEDYNGREFPERETTLTINRATLDGKIKSNYGDGLGSKDFVLKCKVMDDQTFWKLVKPVLNERNEYKF